MEKGKEMFWVLVLYLKELASWTGFRYGLGRKSGGPWRDVASA